MALSDYNTSAALNTTISGINIAEGCPPSGINDAIRQLMADIATAGLSKINVHGTDIASAATVNLNNATGDYVYITGTTGITAITLTEGRQILTKFGGALTLTASGTLIPPGNANFVTQADDVILWVGEASGVVRAVLLTRKNGTPLSVYGARGTLASAATTDLGTANTNFLTITGTTSITALGSSAGTTSPIYKTRFTGILTLTHNATSLILPAGANITTAANDVAEWEYLGSGNWRLIGYLKADGTALIAPVAQVSPLINDFRLSLTSGVPVTTTDVTGATTVYAVPRAGNRIALYDGTNWNLRTSAQFSLALGTLVAATMYDVFCYDNATVPTLEFTAWTNATTRATALAYQDGVLVKSGAPTRRYLGSFYTTSTTQTEDSILKRFLYNYYHRTHRSLHAIDSAVANYTYTSATVRQARANTANKVEAIQGVAEDLVEMHVSCPGFSSSANIAFGAGLGIDSTTAFTTSPGVSMGGNNNQAANTIVHSSFRYLGYPAAGYHAYNWLETGGTGVTFVNYSGQQIGGIVGSIFA